MTVPFGLDHRCVEQSARLGGNGGGGSRQPVEPESAPPGRIDGGNRRHAFGQFRGERPAARPRQPDHGVP